MAVSNASPVNTRSLKDANYVLTPALPNATTTNSNAFDLAQAVPYPVTEKVVVSIASSVGNGANNKNINIALQDSADNSTFTNIVQIKAPILSVTDANNAGYPAGAEVQLLLPPNVKRYIRCTMVGEANGGNAANGTLTFQLLF